MTIPSGAYVDNIVAQINAVKSCDVLKVIVDSALSPFKSMLADLQAELDSLGPFKELLELPGADLAKLATWIEKFVAAQIQPAVDAITKIEAQIVFVVASITRITNALEAAAARMVGCTLTLD